MKRELRVASGRVHRFILVEQMHRNRNLTGDKRLEKVQECRDAQATLGEVMAFGYGCEKHFGNLKSFIHEELKMRRARLSLGINLKYWLAREREAERALQAVETLRTHWNSLHQGGGEA
jgi:hypothetical protein